MAVVQDLEDNFWGRESVTIASSFEHIVRNDEEEDSTPLLDFTYWTVFGDHSHEKGTVINPRSMMRMMVERNEASWLELS